MLIANHWNKVVKKNWGNGVKKRNYISFSDLGKPYIDRYYKMNGEPITNEFDERVLRIFDAGRVIEFIVLRALTMAGILNQKQAWVEIPATDKRLKCLGYLDATIGGFVNWDNAKEIINKHLQEYKLSLDDQLLEQKAINIIEGLKKQYQDGKVPEMLVEVKSINSLAFWAHKNRDEKGNFLGYKHNKLQLYGYMKGTEIERGILLYVSKDDFVMEEVGLILGNEQMEELFNKDVDEMSNYYISKIEPPKEKEIVYNEQKEKFELNWMVSRSGYLTKIYKYKDSVEFEEKNHSKLNEINLALKHLREYEDLNKGILKDDRPNKLKEVEKKIEIDIKKRTLERKIIAEKEIISIYKLNELK